MRRERKRKREKENEEIIETVREISHYKHMNKIMADFNLNRTMARIILAYGPAHLYKYNLLANFLLLLISVNLD